MAINKNKLLHALKADMKAAEVLQKDLVAKRDEWMAQTYGKPYGNEIEGRSKIVSKDIKKQLEWLLPKISDPFISTPEIIRCTPITFEDVASARQSELLLNTQFCRKFPRYNFINKALRVLATEGTVIIQTGWDYEEEIVEEEVEVVVQDEYGELVVGVELQEVVKIKKNQPTAIVCRSEDIFIDPTCMDDMDKCQFVVHRYETDLSTLKQDGRYKNLNKIAGIGSDSDTDFDPEDETSFTFQDEPRKKLLVHEYWGNYDVNEDGIVEQIVCTWVGNTIIRLDSNPYPDGKPPFIVVPFNSIPFQLYGEALAENISDNQKIKTAITRGLIDNMAQSTNGQIGIRRGTLDPHNKKRFIAGKNFEFNGTVQDFWQGGYNPIPGSAFDMIGLMNNEIESQTGTKSFSGGITGGSLGNSATGVRGVLDATSMRTLNIVRNIAENLMKPLMRKWLAYDGEFLEEEAVVRITNSEFVPIRRDDLAGEIDIEITISTAEDNNNKAQQLSFLLQTLGPTEDPTVRRELMADIYELNRMPDKAKKLREYKPEVDPMQERFKQLELERLELENKRIAAEIEDKLARARENDVDRVVKMAKVRKEEAIARLTEEKADRESLQFLKDDHGISHLEKMELEEMKFRANLEQMAMQVANDDKNIGIFR